MQKHSECENFCAIDVAKGICRLSGEIVLIDTGSCAEFTAAPQCGSCAKFTLSGTDEMGICSGYGKEYWTAAKNRAAVCDGYVERG